MIVSLGLLCLAVFAGAVGAVAAPDLSDGVSVLLMLSSPYGANTSLWFNEFERLGWTVTLAGVSEDVRNCSPLCTVIDADTTLAGLPDIDTFDALVISTMPGSFSRKPFPAQDLRESDLALDLVRQAEYHGLTLYASCSGLLVYGDAGILEGRTVSTASRFQNECPSFAGECLVGGFSQLPIADGNVITGTNGRLYAQEIPEWILWNLGRDRRTGSVDSMQSEDIQLQRRSITLGGPAIGAWALGSSGSDGVLAMCEIDGDLAAAGYSTSSGLGATDVLVTRLDMAGNPVWAKTIGGTGSDYGEDICVAADGGLAVVGHTTSAGSGSQDVLLVRLSVSGELEWIRTYGGSGPDAGFGIIATSDGGFALCGRTSVAEDAWSDLYVIKVDGEGQIVWSRTVGGERFERGHAIVEGPDGTLYVAGGKTQGSENYDAWVIGFSASGEDLWDRTFGYRQFDVAEDLLLSSAGDLIVVGYGDREGSDPNDILATRYSLTGARGRLTRIGERRSFDQGQAAVELDDGSILVCGAQTAEQTTQNDVRLVRISPDGEAVWSSQIGLASGNEWASAMCQLSSGAILVAGHTTATSSGVHDVLLMQVDPNWMP